jgi:hypothetical protein
VSGGEMSDCQRCVANCQGRAPGAVCHYHPDCPGGFRCNLDSGATGCPGIP